MTLSRGGTYTNETSDLAITIKNIYYENSKCYKVKAVIFNKRNGIIYEDKSFVLLKENLKSWKRL
jgi:hypothetical protein